MKTFHAVLAVMAIALCLSAASALRAGPSPDLQHRMRPTVTKSAPPPPAVACSPAGQVCSHCQSCATCPAHSANKATS